MFAGNAHARIERTVEFRGALPLEVEEISVTYFNDALIYYILA